MDDCTCTQLGFGIIDRQVDCPIHGVNGIRVSPAVIETVRRALWVWLTTEGMTRAGELVVEAVTPLLRDQWEKERLES